MQYEPESEESAAYYTVRYQGGNVLVAKGMTRMADFAARLKTLNPGVDVTTVPGADPHFRPDATEQPGLAKRFLQSALFPLSVIGLVVWLATETLR